jgi:hypothetical protein
LDFLCLIYPMFPSLRTLATICLFVIFIYLSPKHILFKSKTALMILFPNLCPFPDSLSQWMTTPSIHLLSQEHEYHSWLLSLPLAPSPVCHQSCRLYFINVYDSLSPMPLLFCCPGFSAPPRSLPSTPGYSHHVLLSETSLNCQSAVPLP